MIILMVVTDEDVDSFEVENRHFAGAFTDETEAENAKAKILMTGQRFEEINIEPNVICTEALHVKSDELLAQESYLREHGFIIYIEENVCTVRDIFGSNHSIAHGRIDYPYRNYEKVIQEALARAKLLASRG